MNVSRGLFRAWVLISILWIVGASIIAYGIISPDTVKGSFQPAGKTKGGVDPWKIDYSKPFYETMLSPSAEKLSVTFFPVEWQYKSDWDKDTNLAVRGLPRSPETSSRSAFGGKADFVQGKATSRNVLL
jgi:hypothetical protein